MVRRLQASVAGQAPALVMGGQDGWGYFGGNSVAISIADARCVHECRLGTPQPCIACENDRSALMTSAGKTAMRPLLALSTAIDQLNEKIGYICNWLVLAACVVSAANAMIRYAFGYSSNGWLELQWYMFAVMVMFGASYTFKRNEHVRVEIIYLMLSERGQLWLDLIGTLFFLIPSCLLLAYLSWPFFYQAYAVGELSSNAGGLVRWPIKFVVPAGLVLLALQGVSEVIKRIAALQNLVTIDAKYERPMQ
jgi:TRAP-type mannitol/chloroaromatic compound transport system permease small subunit